MRPPVTAEEQAGREHARQAEPMSEERVEELLRMWRLWTPPAPGRRHPAA
jgi:hypothetical protein